MENTFSSYERSYVVGCCEHCLENVYSNENRYEFHNGEELVHEDCFDDYIMKELDVVYIRL